MAWPSGRRFMLRNDERMRIMTKEQIANVIELRHQGFGYIRIGNAIGVSSNTIAAYCRRKGIGVGSVEQAKSVKIKTSPCKQCGGVVVQNPRRKLKKFCSDKCRNEWWKEHREEANRKYKTHVCDYCGREFAAYAGAKYCSRECYYLGRYSV